MKNLSWFILSISVLLSASLATSAASGDPRAWLTPYLQTASHAANQAQLGSKTIRYQGTKSLLTSQLVQQLSGTGSLSNPGTILASRISAQASGAGQGILPDGSTMANVTGAWIQTPIPDVALYSITYKSKDLKGRPTRLSGLVVVPEMVSGQADPESILVYMHQTITQREDGPSNRSTEAYAAITAFANGSSVLAMPDYLGYGVNRSAYPYAMGKLNAPSGKDIIVAARELMKRLHRSVGQKLFITGYSEGGANAMWLTRYLEEANDPNFVPTLSAPMSGPYDLSGATAKSFVSVQPPITYQENFSSKPTLLSFAAASTAPLIKAPLNSLLMDPLAAQAQGLIPSSLANQTLGARLLTTAINDLGYVDYVTGAPNSRNLIQPALVVAINTQDYSNPAMKLWGENDNVEWTPRSPVHLIGILQDELVPFAASTYPVPLAWSKLNPAQAPYAVGNAQNVIAAMRQKGIKNDRVSWTALDGAIKSATSPILISHADGSMPCSILAQAYFYGRGSAIPQLNDPLQ
ncbi:MAG: hypothetical protein EBT06_10385 [Gammaproteobacteria bacterium]|nr:hypothetical protein [Gammaproteobacteria bacterium]NBT45305.1 hypothetical protein [Gammaproteobacteria bacterium]NBY21642.1 hypothetical protein [Gammaproteobacteria bacterium]